MKQEDIEKQDLCDRIHIPPIRDYDKLLKENIRLEAELESWKSGARYNLALYRNNNKERNKLEKELSESNAKNEILDKAFTLIIEDSRNVIKCPPVCNCPKGCDTETCVVRIKEHYLKEASK